MKIGIYISELLFDHESVILPGFGMFSTEYIPARFIPQEKKVESPSKIISFNSHISKGETPLIDHIAKNESLDKEEVWKFIREFVQQMLESLNEGNKVELQNVGVFGKDADSNIVFEPDSSINYLSDASGLSSVKEPSKSEQESEYIPLAKEEKKSPASENTEKEPTRDSQVFDYEASASHNHATNHDDNSPKAGLPSALKWIAYTIVPLFIIIIIVGLNFRFFFGEEGILRSSTSTQVQEITISQPQPEVEAEAFEAPEEEIAEEMPLEADPMAEPPPADTGRRVYYIVVGSFENHHQAQALAENLRRDGASLAGIFMQTPAGNYRVAYGYYYDLQEAEAQLATVQQQVNPNAWVLHR